MAEPLDPVAVARRARLDTPMDALGTGAFAREPDDGWRLCDPWPMSQSSVRGLTGIVLALTPPPPAPEVDAPKLVLSLRRMMRYFPGAIAWGFVWLVRLVDWSPIWRFKSWRRLRAQSRERAAELLEQMAQSRIGAIRQMIVGLRGATFALYFDQDNVHQAMGYAPLPFMRARIALRKRLLAGEPERPEDLIGPFSKGVLP